MYVNKKMWIETMIRRYLELNLIGGIIGIGFTDYEIFSFHVFTEFPDEFV